ncbi:MAG TPA: hypothetical protein VIW64_00785 [Pyrinomonadaceae bacterium]
MYLLKPASRLLLCAFAALLLLPAHSLGQCGGERWAVKTGADPDSNLIDTVSPASTTVTYLTSLTAPTVLPDNNRIQPTETTLWVINATLKQYQKQADSDYHLLLVDGAGHQMIAEIPSPDCVSASNKFYSGIVRARADFDARYTATSSLKTANVPVQITGVGFFDYLAGQTGVAPNGIELHPVIDIVFLPTSDFALAASPSSLSIAQGSSGSATITSTVSGGFNSAVSLSVSGLPSGATASFNPPSFSAPGSGSTLLTISTTANTARGTYNVVVTGSGGGKTHTANLSLTIGANDSSQQLLGNPGFESGSNSAPWIATTGVIDNSTLQPARSGSWKAWMNGFGTPHTDTLWQQVTIPSSATKATLSFWIYVYTAETSSTVAYDKLSVQLRNSAGAVLATLANYSNLSPKAPYAQASFDLSSYKGQTIQIYLIGVEDQGLQTSFIIDDFALDVLTSATIDDFALGASPSSLSIAQGGSGSATITSTLLGSFNSAVSLSVSGLPSGATASFNPPSFSAPGSGSTLLTISTTANTARGTYNVVVSGSGGGKTHTANLSLTIGANDSSQQLLGNPGFESGINSAPWIATAGVIDNSTLQPARSGSWKAWMNGFGTPHTDTLSQQVTIPSNATKATLSFWIYVYTAETSSTVAYDKLSVQLRNSAGAVLATLANYSNLSPKAPYAQASFDLSSYKGQTIQIYLIGVEDQGLQTSFIIDDFALNVIQ